MLHKYNTIWVKSSTIPMNKYNGLLIFGSYISMKHNLFCIVSEHESSWKKMELTKEFCLPKTISIMPHQIQNQLAKFEEGQLSNLNLSKMGKYIQSTELQRHLVLYFLEIFAPFHKIVVALFLDTLHIMNYLAFPKVKRIWSLIWVCTLIQRCLYQFENLNKRKYHYVYQWEAISERLIR